MTRPRIFSDAERAERNLARVKAAKATYYDVGLVDVLVWVPAADKERLKKYAQSLRTKAGIEHAKLRS